MIHHPVEHLDEMLMPEELALDAPFNYEEEQYERLADNQSVQADWLRIPSSPFRAGDTSYSLYRKHSQGQSDFILFVDGIHRELSYQNISEFMSMVWFYYFNYDQSNGFQRRNGV